MLVVVVVVHYEIVAIAAVFVFAVVVVSFCIWLPINGVSVEHTFWLNNKNVY